MIIIGDTSGTTGASKRVMMQEFALLAMAEVDVADLGITPRSVIAIDRWGIPGLQRVYWARVSGAKVAIYPGHEKQSMRNWVRDDKITHLSCLATTFRWLASGIFPFPSVEVLEVGGEMVDWADVPLARRMFPNAAFINRYACMETRVICRKHVGNGETGEGRMPVGMPVNGVEVAILGPSNGYPRGEIVVKSPYMADGYYNDPELTAAKFRDGWYHTGDLGYWLFNGALLHCGRKDFAQVDLPEANNVKQLFSLNLASVLHGGEVK